MKHAATDRAQVPPHLACPITQELMRDPVIAADGATYERQAITQWLRRNKGSPLTREPMSASMLLPNRNLRAAIDEFSAAGGEGEKCGVESKTGGSSSSTASLVTRLIPCPLEGAAKFSGIAAVGGQLFCAPAKARAVLAIDAASETVRVVRLLWNAWGAVFGLSSC